jgi:hypothetical protein
MVNGKRVFLYRHQRYTILLKNKKYLNLSAGLVQLCTFMPNSCH